MLLGFVRFALIRLVRLPVNDLISCALGDGCNEICDENIDSQI